jgi:2-polyprenyl-6-methoxyphenol hydroxylase-like FAD-dependent oxidoreductase
MAGIESVVYDASPEPRDKAGVFMNIAPIARGVRFEFGKTVESCVADDRSTTLRFRDGTTASGRALVSADGIHSRVRRSVFADAPTPTYTGILNLGRIVSTDLPSTGSAMHMLFGRREFFGYAVRPSGDTYWFSNVAEPKEPDQTAVVPTEGPDMRERLIALHRDDPPAIGRILRAVSGPIGTYPVYDIMTLPRWRQGTVCLIGDAAHAIGPHVGQGVRRTSGGAQRVRVDVPRPEIGNVVSTWVTQWDTNDEARR